MLPEHKKVLLALARNTRPHGEQCWPFDPICRETGLQRARVRFICRLLTRRGLAEFHTALWTEDGYLAGAGYCISSHGLQEANSERTPP